MRGGKGGVVGLGEGEVEGGGGTEAEEQLRRRLSERGLYCLARGSELGSRRHEGLVAWRVLVPRDVMVAFNWVGLRHHSPRRG